MNKKDRGKKSRDRQLKRGKATSGANIKIGNKKLANQTYKTGITKKNIIIKPCKVRDRL
jgi:hypothetical protein